MTLKQFSEDIFKMVIITVEKDHERAPEILENTIKAIELMKEVLSQIENKLIELSNVFSSKNKHKIEL